MTGGAPDSDVRPALFIARSLGVGGAERQLVELANGLGRRGRGVVVAVFYAGGALEHELDGSRVRLIDLRKAGRWDPGLFLVRLWRLVRQIRPGVVHGYLPVANIAATIVSVAAPRARLVWGIRASNADAPVYGRLSRVVFRVSVWLSRRADLLLVNSEAGARFHADRGYASEHMVVVSNGIDTRRFRPDPGAGQAIRARWGVDPREHLVGCVGRLDPMKDPSTFLEAMRILATERLDLRAVWVGSGPRAIARRLEIELDRKGLRGRVQFVDSVDDVAAAYNAFDVLCLPSAFGEGFPNVVGEAMACGVPCVVTDVGDAAGIVGRSGVVVPPSDPVRLADGILRLVGGVQERDRVACRERIVRRFGVERLTSRTERLLWPESPGS